jgi:two-component system response regulator CpxR
MDRHTVLIVDDDEDECESMRDVLVMSHYNVEIARDGNAADTIAQSQPITLAIIDLELHGQDAIELYRRLAWTRPNLVGVFIGRDWPIAGLDYGTTIWINKPIDWQRTLASIDAIFSSPVCQ